MISPRSEPAADAGRLVQTVTGPMAPVELGVTDAHQHAWVAPVAGAAPGGPQLDDHQLLESGLAAYRSAGGGSLLDCQPGGCGRDARALRELALVSGVHIVACTGFHLARYYPPDYWLWWAGVDAARVYFTGELRAGLLETLSSERPVKAGFIKIACTASPADTPGATFEAAAQAAVETGAALMVHTEQGQAAEDIAARLLAYGVPLSRLVLCHVDKRPDLGLHRELAQGGVLLEYDTFFRPKYQPERGVWPLLEGMVAAGMAGQVALGTDMADVEMWRTAGPQAFLTTVVARMASLGWPPAAVQAMSGQNIASRLASAL